MLRQFAQQPFRAFEFGACTRQVTDLYQGKHTASFFNTRQWADGCSQNPHTMLCRAVRIPPFDRLIAQRLALQSSLDQATQTFVGVRVAQGERLTVHAAGRPAGERLGARAPERHACGCIQRHQRDRCCIHDGLNLGMYRGQRRFGLML